MTSRIGPSPGWRAKYAEARKNLAIELWDGTTWSVSEIAEFLGVSHWTVSRYLRGAD